MMPRAAIVRRPGGAFVLVSTHPPSPRSEMAWSQGNLALELLVELVVSELLPTRLPVLVGGDFNATPSGLRSRRFQSATGLRRAKPALHASGTWPGDRAWPFRVAIDDVWASDGVRTLGWTALPVPKGSDHSPVIATLAVPLVGEDPLSAERGAPSQAPAQ